MCHLNKTSKRNWVFYLEINYVQRCNISTYYISLYHGAPQDLKYVVVL
jgi:hypothetical protein